MLPAMLNSGYTRGATGGILASAGALGPIIPPSIGMIVYGSTMNLSIPDMFVAAIIPGVFIAAMYILTNYFVYEEKGQNGISELIKTRKPNCLQQKGSFFGILAGVSRTAAACYHSWRDLLRRSYADRSRRCLRLVQPGT
jgi:TRAP-type C4-dicarboxylate transport system permease large subunit